MLPFALNHMTAPTLGHEALLDLAGRLGCVGVEFRNDLARPIFDGAAPETVAAKARDRGLRIVGLSQVYPFNAWADAIRAEVAALIATARACGAETISLIPRNDGTGQGDGERQEAVRVALCAIRPMLEAAGLVALVEPLGFQRSSLRSKAETVEIIESLGAGAVFQIVHDTFHHTLAGGGALFPANTGIVHVSGVVDPGLAVSAMEDEHRVLVDADDRLGNVTQIAALRAGGYTGPISFEAFSPEIHALADPEGALRRSMAFIDAEVAAVPA